MDEFLPEIRAHEFGYRLLAFIAVFVCFMLVIGLIPRIKAAKKHGGSLVGVLMATVVATLVLLFSIWFLIWSAIALA